MESYVFGLKDRKNGEINFGVCDIADGEKKTKKKRQQRLIFSFTSKAV